MKKYVELTRKLNIDKKNGIPYYYQLKKYIIGEIGIRSIGSQVSKYYRKLKFANYLILVEQ